MADRVIDLLIQLQDEASGRIGDVAKAAAVGVGAIGAAAAGGAVMLGKAALDMASDTRQATNDLQASLGLTREEAEALGDVALEVFGNNFGASVQDAAAVVGDVRAQLGSLADDELQRAAESAMRISDVFGVDTAESLNAVKALTEEFGLSTGEAFDFISSGFQSGLNSSDDFLDSIGEYSNQFAGMGLDADQFFSAMESGLGAGVLGTDKVSDAFKEMRIRLTEGGDEVSDALGGIGLSFDDIDAQVRAGEATWGDYIPAIIDGINEIDDPVKRAQTQTAILGTMAEDLGPAFTSGLDLGATALEDMAGATDSLDAKYQSFGAVAETVKRKFLVALEPMGERLLALANQAMPYVTQALEWFSAQLPGIMAWGEAAVARLVAWLGEFMPQAIAFLSQAWSGVLLPALTAVWGFIQGAVIPLLGQLAGWLSGNLPAAGEAASGFFTGTLVPAFQAVVAWIQENWPAIRDTVVSVFSAIVAFVTPIVSEISTFIRKMLGIVVDWVDENWPLIQETVETIMEAVQSVIEEILDAVQSFWSEHGEAILDAARQIWEAIKTLIETAMNAILGIIKAIMQVITGDWRGAWETIKRVLQDAWNGIISAVEQAVAGLAPLMQAGMDAVLGVLAGLAEKFFDAGAALVAGIRDGIASAWDGLVNWFNDRLDDLTEGLPFSEPRDTTSPLYGLSRSGEAIVHNIQAGIDSAMPDLRGSLMNIGDPQRLVASGGAGSGGLGSVVVQGPLVGTAVVQDQRDLERLADLVAQRLVERVRPRQVYG